MFMEQKEIMPVYRNVLIDVYDENPYKVNKTEEGLDLNEDFINSDSGQIDKKDFFVECAKVLEVGPECKFVRPEDDILVDIRTMTPIPFYGKIYWLIDEGAVRAVINNNLTERFQK